MDEFQAQPSKDTQETLSEADKLRRLAKSDEWQVVQRKFTKQIMDLQSINNINVSDATLEEIKARRIALEYMLDFWRDVTGSVEQSDTNEKLVDAYLTEEFDDPYATDTSDDNMVRRR